VGEMRDGCRGRRERGGDQFPEKTPVE